VIPPPAASACRSRTFLRKDRQRFFEFAEIMEGHDSTAPVGELGNVIARLRFLQLFQEVAEKLFVPRARWLATGEKQKDRATRRQRRTNRSTKVCNLGTRSDATSRRRGSTPKVENSNALSWTALRSFQTTPSPCDGQQHLRNWTQESAKLADHSRRLIKLPPRLTPPECQRKCEHAERHRFLRKA